MTTTPDLVLTREPAAPPRGSGTRATTRWHDICPFTTLMPERGACAMVEGVQVALFLTFEGELFATSNLDPFSGAYVISRGILGTRGGAPTVASPMFKQVFDLRTGACLDDPDVTLRTFPVRRNPDTGRVEVALPDEHRE
ncbi:nitrite reductase small subunit NirD [Actinomadura viridis]|uniref:Nitrite reductase (NADH) small subunit n=1 Tax=Actinomadura viridis TaxID=58110 RepID=A0A931DE54_9ACTN|nr:nitrite reductase small subunit NirD [Actinomadura viridis]MBG6089414.1 nitrite reductase (NADH) small subunit [Actinomadura viridis]